MRTATMIVMATLTLAFSPLVAGREKRESGQGQGTRRSLPATGGWPEQWGERKLHRGELALVYARKKAAADEAARMLRTVVEDVRQDGVTRPAVGLIVVIDAQEEFPEGIDREIAWCLIVPTDAYLGAAWTVMRDAIINDPGVSWKDRWAVRTVFLLTARAARAELRKARQAGLYELLVEGQASLSSEQKKEKIKAYRQKLGLDHDSKSQADQEEKKERPEGGPSSA